MNRFDWIPWLLTVLITLACYLACTIGYAVWMFAAAAHHADSTDIDEPHGDS